MRTSAMRGRFPGFNAVIESTPQTASSNPAAPPTSPSSALSVSNWRPMRHRLAPRAHRIAISLSRAAECASNRLATFAQAIKSTQPTAHKSTNKACRIGATRRSCKPITLTPRSGSSTPGFCASMRLAVAASSAWACAMVLPGFNRAITASKCARRLSRKLPPATNGTHRSY